jgi:hypothetical protein
VKSAARERVPQRTSSTAAHPPRAEFGATLAAAPVALSSPRSVAPTATRTAADTGLTSAAGLGALVFLGAALVGLAFATVPASLLSGISVRLVDRRQDIGLAMALTIAITAAIFVLFVAT